MQGPSPKLDALSEMLALSSYGNTKNIVMTAVECQGPMDVDCFFRTARLVSHDFPQLMSCIREVREWGRYYLVREHRPDLEFPVTVLDLLVADSSASVFDNLMRQLAPRLDRHWDLFNEAPVRYDLVRVSEQHYFVVQIAHHAGADAGTFAEVGKRLFARYDEVVTGKMPEWAYQPHAISGDRKRLVQVREPSFKEVLSNVRESIGQFVEKPTLPLGSGKPDDLRQHHVKRKLSIQETERISKLSAQRGVSLVDLLVACTNTAIDQWNDAFGKAPGVITTSMSVNMKGRFRAINALNNSGLIFFRSPPQERKDPTVFAKSLALSRIKQFRRQMDFKFYQDISRLNTVLRPFPFGPRSKIVNFIMNKHQFSMAITLLGVIWPETRNGKPTANTCFSNSGDFTIPQIHGVGYKLLSNTHLLLIVYVFRNQLNFILHASACLFTREEAESFMDLIMENLSAGGICRTRQSKAIEIRHIRQG